MRSPRGQFGVDAPSVLLGLTSGATTQVAIAVVAFVLGWWIVGLVFLLTGAYTAASAASYAYTTLRGKFTVWSAELDAAAPPASALTLDLGTGRGLVLIATALRTPAGRSTGIDLWRTVDQSGNAESATLANAAANGVEVTLTTGDIRALPYPDDSFDLVTSALAIHNIPSADDRATAVTEALRVLRPGGQLLLADILHTAAYAATLRTAGATEVRVRDLGWRYWYGGPWTATRMVEAGKP